MCRSAVRVGVAQVLGPMFVQTCAPGAVPRAKGVCVGCRFCRGCCTGMHGTCVLLGMLLLGTDATVAHMAISLAPWAPMADLLHCCFA